MAPTKRPMTHQRRHRPFCAVADRLSAYRRRPHGAVQLALRPPALRRHVPAAHRGHRPAALDAGGGRRDHRRAVLARARLGRRDRAPVRPRRPPCRGRAPAAGARAAPITATARRPSSRRCASGRAPRSARCATTAPGATAIPPRRRRHRAGDPAAGRRRRARRRSATLCRARSRCRTPNSTI